MSQISYPQQPGRAQASQTPLRTQTDEEEEREERTESLDKLR